MAMIRDFVDYLAHIYDLSKIRKIYVLCDGAVWIKNGVPDLTVPGVTVKYALDGFHPAQAVIRMTSDEAFREALLRYLYSLKREEFDNVAEIARTYISDEKKLKKFDETLDYIHSS